MAYLSSNIAGHIPNAPENNVFTRNGFLLVQTDRAAAKPDFKYVAHVLGRLGQGYDTNPDNISPFYWGVIEKSKSPGMLISLFPEADADTGLDSAEKLIVIDAVSKKWSKYSSFLPPS